MLAALTFALFANPPQACVPERRWTDQERRNSYVAIRSTCSELGASDHVCEAAVAMAWRESRGVPSVHTRGHNEYGLGFFGHSPKFWSWLLRPLGHEAFCDVRLSTAALLREFQFAIRRGGKNLRDLQRVHSGRPARDESRPRKDNRWCWLLANGPRDDQHVVSWESLDCKTPVTLADLGRPLDDAAIRALAK
jgi:hypothetical protein